jgi:hypothetical protein
LTQPATHGILAASKSNRGFSFSSINVIGNNLPEVAGPFDVIVKGLMGELIQIATNAISPLDNDVQAEPFGVSHSSRKWACLQRDQLSGAQKRPFAETT